MKAIKIISIVLLLLAGAGIGIYAYHAGFSSITVSKGDFKSTEIVFSTHKGAYKDLHKSWSKFQKGWEAAGLKACDSLGVYFDPPGTPDEKLRSVIACRIDTLPEGDRALIRSKLPNFRLPASKSLVAKFPYKSVMSLYMGPMKVYPKMKKIIDEEKLSHAVAIESYGIMQNVKDMWYYLPTETKAND